MGAGERRAGSRAAPGRPVAARGPRSRAAAGAVRRVAEPRRRAVLRAVGGATGRVRRGALQARRHPRRGMRRCWSAWRAATGSTRSTSRASIRARSPRRTPTPSLYRRVAAALPGVWLEDPDLSDPAAAAALDEHRDRVTWDAPIHCAADIGVQPWPARTVNIKPSRFGTLRALLDAYDHCAAGGIGVYGGGQYELGPWTRPDPVSRRAVSPRRAERHRALRLRPADAAAGCAVLPDDRDSPRDRVRRRRPITRRDPGRQMRQLTLLAIPDCPLSAHGRRILARLAADRLRHLAGSHRGYRRRTATSRRARRTCCRPFSRKAACCWRTGACPRSGCGATLRHVPAPGGGGRCDRPGPRKLPLGLRER